MKNSNLHILFVIDKSNYNNPVLSNDDKPLEIFIKKFILIWKGLWEYVHNQRDYTNDKKDRYLRIKAGYMSFFVRIMM
ncbi:hypothetical protein LS482_09400 [Sinomicrobium kalidii]|uniref:hypothetical protein n=1 Tax=Sinomicrobium kalidii TaxID=2900738 RepID=UPI001E345F7D|nr:hypothetical protein [Sinomicrobium kalidii]UGU18082.1 hypothetical protein LS482_09400 [Sinomicrobium kalidii]